MNLSDIKITDITVPDNRVKRLDPAATELKAADIAERGLMHPITLEKTEDGYELVAGYGRLAACIDLEWDTIPAHVHEFKTKDHKREWEIMENVVRDELTALDRARSLYELDAIYKERHPELKKGGNSSVLATPEDRNAIVALRSELLDQVGLGKRSFETSIALWKGLTMPSRERVQGTWLADQQSGLIALSKESRDRQSKILDVLFPKTGEPKATSVSDAIFIIDHGSKLTSQENKFAKLTKTFDALSDDELDVVFSGMEDKIAAWAKRNGKAL